MEEGKSSKKGVALFHSDKGEGGKACISDSNTLHDLGWENPLMF